MERRDSGKKDDGRERKGELHHSPLGNFSPTQFFLGPCNRDHADPSSRSLFTDLGMHEAMNFFYMVLYASALFSFMSVDKTTLFAFLNNILIMTCVPNFKLYTFGIVDGLKTSIMHINADV